MYLTRDCLETLSCARSPKKAVFAFNDSLAARCFLLQRTVAATLLKEAQLNYFEDTKIRRTVDSSVATKVVKW